MKPEEFITSVKLGGKLINIGLDDYGQCYFVEYVEDNEIKELGLGTYNFEYMDEVEYLFGDPEIDCPIYVKDAILYKCEKPNRGFCSKCPYSDPDNAILLRLRDMGALDNHFNPTGKWLDKLKGKVIDRCIIE